MIRKATIYDVFDIANMWVEMQKAMSLPLRSYDDAEKEKFIYGLTQKIYKPDRVILVAIHEQKCTGFIMGYAHYFEYGTSNLIGTCEHLYVEESHRNNGLAYKLIDTLQNHGKAMGCGELEIITKYDPAIIKAYERKGFTPSEVVFTKEI